MAGVDGREPDGWKHDDDGWYDDGWTSDAADADAGEAPNPYRVLPPRVEVDDMVGESDVSVPPFDPALDPNREVSARWGGGMAGL